MSSALTSAGTPTPENDVQIRTVAPDLSPDVVVHLEKVTRVYQQDSVAVHALDGIDLEIRRGDFAVLVGPSGSGKTTLLNLIGGLDSPTTGRIWIAGTETGRMSKAELSEMRLRKIGFVFQEFNLIPVLSALENVEFVMLLQGQPEAQRQARSMALLKELGLQGLEHRRPAESRCACATATSSTRRRPGCRKAWGPATKRSAGSSCCRWWRSAPASTR